MWFKNALNRGSYGFFYDKNFSTELKSKGFDLNISSIMTTGKSMDYANNHCGATVATNILMFFSNFYKINDLMRLDAIDVFKLVHKKIGNGPVISIAKKLKSIFKSFGYNLKYKKLKNTDEIKRAIDKKMPVATLLENGILNWHWVLAYGYVEDENDLYFRILDSWTEKEVYYLPSHKARLVSSTAYWIEK